MALLGLIGQWRASGILPRGLFLFLASATIYGYEFFLGIEIWRNPASIGLIITLVFVLIGAYALGLGRAWELLGAPRTGFLSYFWALLGAIRRRPKS